MSKYTKDAPFEFEGMKVWRDGDTIEWSDYAGGAGFLREHRLRKYVAFIEAERNEWAYTNDEHTEARKGRWVAESGVTFEWAMRHQDIPNIVCVHPSPGDESYHRYVREALDDFLAWHAAQNQPAEPTGLGAVVEVSFDADRETATPWTRDPMGGWHNGTSSARRWSELAAMGSLTIRSPGVDA